MAAGRRSLGHIYGLGKKATIVLVEKGNGKPELLSEPHRIHELKELSSSTR